MTAGRHGVIGGVPGVTVARHIVAESATVIAKPNFIGALFDRCASRFGLALTDGPVAVRGTGLTLVGTGPGKWLAILDPDGPTLACLTEALEGAAAVIPQTGGYAVLRVSGPRVLDMLAKCVALDLDRFAVGTSATTQAHHMGVTLWKVDEAPTFDLAAFRSSAGSFWHMVEAAGAEYGVAVPG